MRGERRIKRGTETERREKRILKRNMERRETCKKEKHGEKRNTWRRALREEKHGAEKHGENKNVERRET